MNLLRILAATLLLSAGSSACSRQDEPASPPAAAATPTVAEPPRAAPQAEPAGDDEKILIVFIEADPDIGPAPLEVRFSVWDPYHRLERPKYRWDFGDGSPISTERFPVHVYTKPGDYEAKLIVEEDGATDEDSVDIQVDEPEADGE